MRLADGTPTVAAAASPLLAELRPRITSLFLGVLQHVQTHFPDDSATLILVVKMIAELFINFSSASLSTFVPNKGEWKALALHQWYPFSFAKVRPPSLLQEKALHRHLHRLNARSNFVFSPTHQALADQLLLLCTHAYSSVRKTAQEVLCRHVLHLCPWLVNSVLAALRAHLAAPSLPKHVISGTLFTMASLSNKIARHPAHRAHFLRDLCLLVLGHDRTYDEKTQRRFLWLFWAITSKCYPFAPAAVSPAHARAISLVVRELTEQLVPANASSLKTPWMHQLLLAVALMTLVGPHGHAAAEEQPAAALLNWYFASLVSDILPIRRFAQAVVTALLAHHLPASLPDPLPSLPPATHPVLMGDHSLQAHCMHLDPLIAVHLPSFTAAFTASFAAFFSPAPAALPTDAAFALLLKTHLAQRLDPPELSPAVPVALAAPPAAALSRLVDLLVVDHKLPDAAGGADRSSPSDLLSPWLSCFRWFSTPFPAPPEGIKIAHLVLWTQIAYYLGPDFARRRLGPEIDRLLAQDTPEALLGALELIGGLLRASCALPPEPAAALWDDLAHAYFGERFFDRATPVDPWLYVLRYAIANLDPSRFQRPFALFFDRFAQMLAAVHAAPSPLATVPPAAGGVAAAATPAWTPVQQHKLCRWITAWLQEFCCQATPLIAQFAPPLAAAFQNPYHQVRESIADLAATLFKVAHHPGAPCHPALLALAQDLLQRWSELEHRAAPALAPPADHAGLPEASPALSAFRDTLSMGLLSLLSSPLGSVAILPYLPPLLRPLFSCHQDADKEVVRQAGACFALLGQLAVSQPLFDQILAEIQHAAKSPSHTVRLAALPFLRLFVFTNQSQADAPARALITSLIQFRLQDPHPDVREQAASTLAALLNFLLRPDIPAWFDRSLLLARTALGQATDAAEASRSARIRKRHAGVLGLCAILLMSPYDMPPLCAQILQRLSEHIADPISAIRTSVSRTISEFKRTHVDQLQPNQALSAEAELLKTLFVSDTACYS